MRVESVDNLLTENLPRGCVEFFRQHRYMKGKSQRCLVMRCDSGTIIACLRYRVAGLRSLRMLGTWVHPGWRRQGIAATLWRTMLEREQPKRVRVVTISRGGHGLVASMQKSGARVIEHMNYL